MQQLYIVGLGRGDRASLAALEEKKLLKARSLICPALPPHLEQPLQQKGWRLISLQPLLNDQEKLSFAGQCGIIAGFLRELLKTEKVAVLMLPGTPWPGDALVNFIYKEMASPRLEVQCLPGEDVLPSLLESIRLSTAENNRGSHTWDIPFSRGVALCNAVGWEEMQDPSRGDLIVSQVYSKSLLVRVAEQLCRIYPSSHPAALWQFDQFGNPSLSGIWQLQELVSNVEVALHCWSFLHLSPSPRCSLGEMTSIMTKLRSPGGCPWDRKQDHYSLRPYLLEEAYEVLEAIDQGEKAHLCEELGDLLLQVIFHSELAREEGDFTLWDVIDGITRKIYRRHPHVFKNEKLEDVVAVAQRWQEIKQQEKGGKVEDRFAMPAGLPALMKAQKVQKRAAAVGFDWPCVDGALQKVAEELRELEVEMQDEDGRERVAEEYGDLLFALVNVARFLGVDAEQALSSAVQKFTRRFKYIEKKVENSGRNFTTYSLEELDKYWEEAKKEE